MRKSAQSGLVSVLAAAQIHSTVLASMSEAVAKGKWRGDRGLGLPMKAAAGSSLIAMLGLGMLGVPGHVA